MKSVYQKKKMRMALAAFAALCCARAHGQTNGPAASVTDTNLPAGGTNVTQLGSAIVVGHLNQARSAILPDLGATAYTETQQQIQAVPGGDNSGFNQLVLRAPGVAQDSAVNGDLHVRGEHANLQYRIDDVLLPESISGFGLELDPRFVDSMQLITGSLPAQYGFRTAGIVDIQTKSGMQNGGEVGVYGGSYDTIRPYAEYGGRYGKWTFYGDASYEHNALGIENTTGSSSAIHDATDQDKMFLYGSYLIDDSSRLTMMGGASYSTFQVPDTAGQSAFTANAVPGIPSFDSSDLNENQIEQNYYGILAYQKSAGNLNYQASAYGRASRIHFEPDPIGDLYLNGVASDDTRNLYSGGLQLDASYELGDKHTIRGGFMFLDEYVAEDNTTLAFDVDASGAPTTLHAPIIDNHEIHGIFAGAYIQDEWKILPKVTINYGARFDEFYSTEDKENQPSPRANLIYQVTDSTTLHGGYARYFTPPPPESIDIPTFSKYAGTTAASPSTLADPVKSERANYFDAGISQKVGKNLTLGVDGYYKSSRNQLDDGLFGQTLILDAFNYRQGLVYGVEFTASYTKDGFSAYANVALSRAKGSDWDSSEFLFDPGDAAYVKNHWIFLDHDQTVSGSFGVSYMWKEHLGNTRVFCDAIYGSGLRQDSTAADGTNIPNGGSVPAYSSVSLGVEQLVRWRNKDHLRARLDVINISDNVYELRSGSGVGVNAAQYGMRRGFFGTLSYLF